MAQNTKRWVLLLLVGFFGIAAPSGAEFYKWTDANGTPHFSDRIEDVPPAHRNQALSSAEHARDEMGVNFGVDIRGPKKEDTAEAGPVPAALDPRSIPLEPKAAKKWLEGLSTGKLALVIAVVLGGLAFSLLVWAVVLIWAASLVGAEPPEFLKGFAIVSVFFVVGLIAQPGLILIAGLPAAASGTSIGYEIVNLVVQLGLQTATLRGMHCDSVGQSLLVAIATNVLTVVIGVVLGFLVFCAAMLFF